MERFILYRQNLPEAIQQKIKQQYNSDSTQKVTEVKLGEYSLIYSEKENQNLSQRNPRFADNLFVFGSCLYKGNLLQSATEQLIDDIDKKQLKPDNFFGHFAIVSFHYATNQLEIIIDRSSGYMVFFEGEFGLVSNSFELLLNIRSKNEIDLAAVSELVTIGGVVGASTYISGIKKLTESDLKDSTGNISVIDISKPSRDSQNDKSNTVDELHELLQNSIQRSLLLASNDRLCDIGTSGGYDSRLLISYLLKLHASVNFHTIYKLKDPDLTIAQELSKLLNFKLNYIDGTTLDRTDETIRDAFSYFDYQIALSTDLRKYNYSKHYKNLIVGASQLSLSGIGGEILRNKCNLPWFSSALSEYVDYYLIHYSVDFTHRKYRTKLIESIASQMGEIAQIDHLTRTTFASYIRHIYVPTLYSNRISAENKYGNFVAPLVNYPLFQFVRSNTPLFVDNSSINRLIQNNNHDLYLARLAAGYSPAQYASKAKTSDFLKRQVPLFARNRIREMRSNPTTEAMKSIPLAKLVDDLKREYGIIVLANSFVFQQLEMILSLRSDVFYR